MNSDSASGKRHDTHDSLNETGQAGDWYLDDVPQPELIWIWIPKAGVTIWELSPHCDGYHPCWKWDGNRDAPTLTPSLHLVGTWHGWMKNGRLESV